MRNFRIIGAVLLTMLLALPFAGAQGSAAGFPIQRDPSVYLSPSGFMDMRGNIVLQPVYSAVSEISAATDQIKRLSAGKADKNSTDTYGYIRRGDALFTEKGERLTDFIYDYIERVDDGIYAGARYERDENTSGTDILDAQGNIVFQMGLWDYLFRNTGGYLYLDNTEGACRVALLDGAFKELRAIELSAEATFSYIGGLGEGEPTQEPTAIAIKEKGKKTAAVYDVDLNRIMQDEYADIYQLTDTLFFGTHDMLNYALITRDGEVLTDFSYQYMHTNYASARFIEASAAQAVILLATDGTPLTTPNEFQYYDTYATQDFAIGYRDAAAGGPELILPDGSRRGQLGVDIYELTPLGDNRVILTPHNEDGSISAILYRADTGARIELDTPDMDFTSCYAFDVGGGSFMISYQKQISEENYRLTSISCLYDRDGKMHADSFANAFEAYGSKGLILAQKGVGNLKLWGIIDSSGQEVTPFRYSRLQVAAPGIFMAQEGGKIGYIDAGGNWIYTQSAYANLMD